MVRRRSHYLLPPPRPTWAGYYTHLPPQLRQAFDPVVQMHLERLTKGEITETCAFVSQIGFLKLQWRKGKIWAIYINDLECAKLVLQNIRKVAAAIRCGTVLKNPKGGMWLFQPPASILPLSLQIFLPASLLRKQQLVEFRQDPPWRVNSFNSNFSDERKQFVKSSCRWLTPSVPCAVRAPTPALPLAER